MKPPVELLHRLFRYEPETGALIRLITTSNRCPAGTRAGTVKTTGKYKKAYRQVRIESVLWHEHGVIWAMMTGEWPPDALQVDHMDDDGLNNRWSNLQLATPVQNLARKRGHVGLRWHKQSRIWVATIAKKYVGSSPCWGIARKKYIAAHIAKYGEWSPHNATKEMA